MTEALHIVADAHIWGVEAAFSLLPGYEVTLTTVEANEIDRALLMDADILLTRSATRVDEALLTGTPVRFAATATIGDDHYDKAWLEANGIGWANAAGSSTGSVVEYMLAALLHLHESGRIDLPSTRLGIIGVGRIGSQLAEICRRLGMELLLNDPPRARSEGEAGFVSLDRLLRESDLITLHTPLIREGEDSTLHLIDRERLAGFTGFGIINAARGACVDNAALKSWLDSHPERFAALDCWESEPGPDSSLFAHPGMILATPHIAGHSLDGKAANTLFAYRALCSHLGIQPAWEPATLLPTVPPRDADSGEGDCWSRLYRLSRQLYDIEADHHAMQGWAGLEPKQLAVAFRDYRRHYPVRRAWHLSPLRFDPMNPNCCKRTHVIGLNIV